MAVSIGTVYMDLRAASTGLKKDIDKAMGRSKKQFAAAGKAISKVVATSIAGASTAIAAATAKGLSAVDNLAKTSDRLGTATENLQAFRHAAELTGATSRTLDMGLQRMTRRIAEAAQGTGAARDAIRELGLEASELGALSIDDQFIAISEAMQQVKNSGDQVRLTQKLFDSEGVALVNTLRLGREGLEAARRELDEFGVSISRVDAAKVERANDAMARLRQVIGGISNRLAVELAPMIEHATNRLIDMARSGDLVGKTVKSSMDFVAGIGSVIQNVIHAVKIGVNALGAGVSAVGFTFASVIESARKLLNGFQDVSKIVFNNFDKFARTAFRAAEVYLIDFLQEATTRLRGFQETFMDLGRTLSNVPGLQAFGAALTSFGASADAFSAKLQRSRASRQREIAGLVTDVADASGQIAKAWEKAMSDQTEGSVAMVRDTFGELFKETTDKLEKLSEKGFPGLGLIESIQGIGANVDAELSELEKKIKERSAEIPEINVPVKLSLETALSELGTVPGQALAGFRQEFERLVSEYKSGAIGLDQFTRAVQIAKENVRAAEQVFQSTRTNAENYNAEVERLTLMHESGSISTETYNRALANTARRYDLTQKPIKAVEKATQKYGKTIQKLREQLNKGLIDQEEFAAMSIKAGEQFQEAQDRIEERLQAIQDAWNSVNHNISRSIDDLVDHGKFSFKDLANSIINDLTKIAIKRALFGNGLGSEGGGGLFGGLFGGIKSIFGFANGGRPPTGQLSLVGEKGPELFVPDVRGTIVPANITSQLMKSRNIPAASSSTSNQLHFQQVNHFEAGVTPAQVAESLNEHGKEIFHKFVDQFQRGGSFRQVFQS